MCVIPVTALMYECEFKTIEQLLWLFIVGWW